MLCLDMAQAKTITAIYFSICAIVKVDPIGLKQVVYIAR